MDIRKGRGVWRGLALAGRCHVKRAKMYWWCLQWLKQNKGHRCGWLKQQNQFCIRDELSESSTPPLNSVFLCTAQRSDSPVALPCVSNVGVVDVVFVGLLVQEIKHVLDGQWQGAASVGCAEDGLKQIIHKLLQCALREGRSKRITLSLNNAKNWQLGFYWIWKCADCRIRTYTEHKPTTEEKNE